jgi:hypothetical protein
VYNILQLVVTHPGRVPGATLPRDLTSTHSTKMPKLLAVILYYAALATAITKFIKVHGQPNHDMVNSMYHAFSGLWNLSPSGVTGFERAAIRHLIFHPMSNSTTYTNSTSISKVKRDYPNVSTPTCYNPGDNHSLFTIQQEQWIVGAFCSTFSQT